MKKRLFVLLIALSATSFACRTHDLRETAPSRTSDGGSLPISIAVVPFRLASGTPAPPFDVADLIRTELASTGRFAPMTTEALPSRPSGLADIEFEQWRRANMDFVVVGLVAIVHDDGHEIEFRLVDTRAQKSVVEFVVPSAPGGLRDTAQKIAGIIDRRLTTSTQATRRP